MIKLFVKNPFEKVKTLLEDNLASADHSLEDILIVSQQQIPKLIKEIFQVPDSLEGLEIENINQIKKDIDLNLVKALHDLDDLLIDFWKRKRERSLLYYKGTIKTSSIDIQHYKHLLTTMAKNETLDISGFNFDNTSTATGQFIIFNQICSQFIKFYESEAAIVFSGVLDSLATTEDNLKVYTQFNQKQLGLLTKVLSETHGSNFGFTNLKKTTLDKLLASHVITENGPITDYKNLNKVTFGSVEVIDSDIVALENYFNGLLNTLRKCKK